MKLIDLRFRIMVLRLLKMILFKMMNPHWHEFDSKYKEKQERLLSQAMDLTMEMEELAERAKRRESRGGYPIGVKRQ
jgi:hypothetical protein